MKHRDLIQFAMMRMHPSSTILIALILSISTGVPSSLAQDIAQPESATDARPPTATPGPAPADEARDEQSRVMRSIIDEQQQQLKSQQQQIDAQRAMLESMQKQLLSLSRDRTEKLEELEVAREQAEEAVAAAEAAQSQTRVRRGQAGTRGKSHNLNPYLSDTARFPLDISDSAGVFIRSSDGTKMLRLFGSLRARGVWEDRDNIHDFDINIPQVPIGEDDRSDQTINFNTRDSRIGMDVDMLDVASIRMEFDWKGTDDEFRRRHMFIRSNNWVFGKTWSAFNTLPAYLMTLDGHTSGAASGTRSDQIKYMNSFGDWRYQVSLEDQDPDIIAPDELGAKSRRKLPNFVGNLSWSSDSVQGRVAGLLAPNRVRYDGGSDDELGWGLWLGGRWQINPDNTLKSHVIGTSGQVGALADFAFESYDMVYDPNSGEFENLQVYGGQLGLEHKWTPTLSSSIGASYLQLDSKSFQEDEFFHDGYKGVVNLIYRPRGRLKGWFVGGELVHVSRTNKDNKSSTANRATLLTYYDF